mmetsp:Transcript_6031/g.10845  ORF Transcript_6031/g.10845 Transcript_6031/m.10845 type:complete len:249 (-) Transcript_6031:73-819(-)|eukprot:CAMPEP_0184702080 /NCGR_PEP_ID=MMETSP0313-20130426/22651_1 /TAXON_ID=2792 /ORGANISM="Porphyridium aerugineum, Strain SAG 1380-2" /LENGTH=248 /DNA_ID=CAMNT_0027162381 /DNA_START=27 /DNA_END=773 /DNA_ORIENTATION=+
MDGPSASPSTGTDFRPTGALIHSILKLLQTELKPMSSQEIKSKLGPAYDLAGNATLRDNLKANPKVLREPDGRWRWKAKYYLRNKDDLLAFLSQTTIPIIIPELYDSYKGVKEDIEDIIKENNPRRVIVIKNPALNKNMLFNYDPKLFVHVEDEIKAKYNQIRLPADMKDVHRLLLQTGLKVDETMEVGPDGELRANMVHTYMRKRSKKHEARKSKRVKLTNVHMEGTNIDLTRDVDLKPGKASAFKN